MDTDEMKAAADAAADENGMAEVTAMIDGVRDNGHTYAACQRFHMHTDLVPAAVAAGQVTFDGHLAAADAAAAKAKQQQMTPRDKQQRGASDKGGALADAQT